MAVLCVGHATAGEPRLRPPERGTLKWYVGNQLRSREDYTISHHADGVRVTGELAARPGDGVAASVVRSLLVLRPGGRPDSLYLWPAAGAPPEVVTLPDSVSAATPPGTAPPVDEPFPFDSRAGLHLLASLIERHARRGPAPDTVRLLPGGEVVIRHLAADSVHATGADLLVDRYRVHGLASGPWHLWLTRGDFRALAGVALDVGCGVAADGFGVVLPRLARLAWIEEGRVAAGRLERVATRLAGRVVLAGAAVEDGAGHRWEPGVVIVEGGVTIAAGPARAAPSDTTGARRIDLSGRVVRPGRVLAGGSVAPDSLIAALASGFTTVVARPGYLAEIAVESLARLGWIGPRVVLADRAAAAETGPGVLRAGAAADLVILERRPAGNHTIVAVLAGGALVDIAGLRGDQDPRGAAAGDRRDPQAEMSGR